MTDKVEDASPFGSVKQQNVAPTARIGLLAAVLAMTLGLVGWCGLSHAGGLPAAGQRGGSITVTNADQLVQALGRAQGGTINLAAGVYAPVLIKGVSPAAPLTIRSADPARPAVLTGMTITNSGNLVLDGLAFGPLAPGQQYALSILGSHDVVARRLAITWKGGVQGRSVISAVFLRNSRHIEISDSRFSDHWHGISFLDVDGLRIANNLLAHLRTDGIRGGGASNAVVEGNVIGSFHPDPGDHPDGIQFWSTHEKLPGRNIVIRGNLVWRGSGPVLQGIFIRDTFDNLPFENVTIEDNLLVGTMYNGLALSGGNGVVIRRNRVIAYPDMKSWLSVRNLQGATVADNAAALFIENKVRIPPANGNRELQPVRDQGAAEIRTWLAAHPQMRARFDALSAAP